MPLTATIYTVASIILGVVICFAGYKLFRVALGLIGAVLGAQLGNYLFSLTGNIFEGTLPGDVSLGIYMLVLAVVVAALSFSLYMKAVVIVLMVLGGWWFYNDYSGLASQFNLQSALMAALVGGAIGLLIGLAVYFFKKWITIIATAIIGAKFLTMIIVPLISNAFWSETVGKTLSDVVFAGQISDTSVAISAVLLVFFATCGASVQMKTKN